MLSPLLEFLTCERGLFSMVPGVGLELTEMVGKRTLTSYKKGLPSNWNSKHYTEEAA